MAIRNILTDRDTTLKKVSRKVEVFDSRLHMLIDDLWDTLDKAEGLGLAAPQVGVLKRVCIVNYDDDKFELVNPKLISSSGSCLDNEGCLSVEGFRGIVERPEEIEIEYCDRNGKSHRLQAQGYFARVFLHEMDHLDGILFSDKMIRKVIDNMED